MIDTEALRKKVIDLAIQGKLTEQLPSDGDAEVLYSQIQEEKTKVLKEGKIKKANPLPMITNDEIPFEIPKNWKWVRLGELCLQITDGTHRTPTYKSNGIPFLSVKNISSGTFDLTDIKYISEEEHSELIKRCKPEKNDVLVCRIGTLGKAITIDVDLEFSIFVSLGLIKTTEKKISDYIVQVINSGYGDTWIKDNKAGGAMHTYKINLNSLALLPVPLAPISEIERILYLNDEVKTHIENIYTLQSKYSNDLAALKSKIIDAGIQGKLTEQLPEDGTAEELYEQIQEEKAKLVKEGKIKKNKELPDIAEDEIPFDIPKSWKWVWFGNTTFIERGGSPRPIKSYITDSEDGINWIKIGDVEKGGKYIYSTKEKIIPEGEKKSRHVYPGDFLLTNSMSFGRPYISKVEGCIHDGWLLIRNLKGFCPDYLYYLLSSSYMYGQFCNKASGATVDNLNIDKVNTALIPLPPMEEQKRISKTIEELLSIIS